MIPLAVTKAGGSPCKLLFEATQAEEEIKEATVSLVEAEEKGIQVNADVFYFGMKRGNMTLKAASMENPTHLAAYFVFSVNTHLCLHINR